MLWIGFAFWLLGVGLKVNFSRTIPVWAEVLTLIVEGIGIGFVHQPGKLGVPICQLCYNPTDFDIALVALQALCKPHDRAVATSTRNLMRMLVAVTGLATSTAVQYAVTNSALPSGTELSTDMLAEAKMKGIRAVFIIMVPLIAMCGLSCFVVPNTALLGDERQVIERDTPVRRE